MDDTIWTVVVDTPNRLVGSDVITGKRRGSYPIVGLGRARPTAVGPRYAGGMTAYMGQGGLLTRTAGVVWATDNNRLMRFTRPGAFGQPQQFPGLHGGLGAPTRSAGLLNLRTLADGQVQLGQVTAAGTEQSVRDVTTPAVANSTWMAVRAVSRGTREPMIQWQKGSGFGPRMILTRAGDTSRVVARGNQMYSLDGSTWVWASDSCHITRVLVTGAVSRMTLRGLPRFNQAPGGRWRCAVAGMAFDGGSTLWLALPAFRGKGFGTVVPVNARTGRVLGRATAYGSPVVGMVADRRGVWIVLQRSPGVAVFRAAGR